MLCFFYISKLEKVGVSAAVYTALWATFGGAGFIWYKADGNLLGSFLARVGIIAVIFTVATAVSNYLGNVAYSLVRRLYDKKYPDMALGMCLLDLVYQLEKPKAVWQDLEVRTYSLNLLGKAAFLVRKHLFRTLRVSDPGIQKWQEERVKAMAAALSDKQRWLITPKPTTQEELLSRTAGMLLATLRGEWDSFDASTAESVARIDRVRIFTNARQVIQKLSAAFSPMILMFFVRKYELMDLDPTLNNYLGIGILLWAAVSLLYVLDPRPDDKVSMIKNIISVARAGDKKAAE